MTVQITPEVTVTLPKRGAQSALPDVNATLEQSGAPYRILSVGDSEFQVAVKGRAMSHVFGPGTSFSAGRGADERWRITEFGRA